MICFYGSIKKCIELENVSYYKMGDEYNNVFK